MPNPEGFIPEQQSGEEIQRLLLPLEQPETPFAGELLSSQEQSNLGPTEIELASYQLPQQEQQIRPTIQKAKERIPNPNRPPWIYPPRLPYGRDGRVNLWQFQQDHPEDRVVKQSRWSLLMGSPEANARRTIKNIDKPFLYFFFRENGRPWGRKLVREAMKAELNEILSSENELLKQRAVSQIKTTGGNLLTHILFHVIAPEVPIAGRLFFIGKAIKDGHYDHILTESVLAIPDTIVVTLASAAFGFGTFVPVIGTIIGYPAGFAILTASALFNFFMQGVERRHDREHNNQAVPLIAAVLSKDTNPNLKDKKRFVLANELHQVFLEDPEAFRRLPQEALDLDPENPDPETGLQQKEQEDYKRRKDEVTALSDAMFLYGVMSDKEHRWRKKDMIRELGVYVKTKDASLITSMDLKYLLQFYDSKELWEEVKRFRFRTRGRAEKDKRILNYFYEKYKTELNNLYLHPHEEVMRARNMQSIASERYPDMTEI